jgi:dTDP-4-amino-4,6-dideoxygalactose transaminase
VTVPIAAPTVSDEAADAVQGVLESGYLADGDVVRRFESAFADFVGVEHAVATASGTAALHVMLEAAGVGDGDAVLTTPFSFVSTASAVVHAGGRPAFADVRASTANLDPETVRAVLDRRDDAVALMPVHLYGLPAAMDAFRDVADDYGLVLLEDAAQAHGARVGDEMVGAVGDAAAFSFYPTKNMTTGEGGMVTTDDPALAARLRQLVDHGRDPDDGRQYTTTGYNYRMTNLAAAIGCEQLRRLPEWIERRRENADRLTDALEAVPAITTPSEPAGRHHAYHQYTVRTPRREALVDALDAADVGYGIYYPRPIPAQPAHADHGDGPYETAAELSETVVSLPVHPQLSAADLDRVVTAVEEGLA